MISDLFLAVEESWGAVAATEAFGRDGANLFQAVYFICSSSICEG